MDHHKYAFFLHSPGKFINETDDDIDDPNIHIHNNNQNISQPDQDQNTSTPLNQENLIGIKNTMTETDEDDDDDKDDIDDDIQDNTASSSSSSSTSSISSNSNSQNITDNDKIVDTANVNSKTNDSVGAIINHFDNNQNVTKDSKEFGTVNNKLSNTEDELSQNHHTSDTENDVNNTMDTIPVSTSKSNNVVLTSKDVKTTLSDDDTVKLSKQNVNPTIFKEDVDDDEDEDEDDDENGNNFSNTSISSNEMIVDDQNNRSSDTSNLHEYKADVKGNIAVNNGNSTIDPIGYKLHYDIYTDDMIGNKSMMSTRTNQNTTRDVKDVQLEGLHGDDNQKKIVEINKTSDHVTKQNQSETNGTKQKLFDQTKFSRQSQISNQTENLPMTSSSMSNKGELNHSSNLKTIPYYHKPLRISAIITNDGNIHFLSKGKLKQGHLLNHRRHHNPVNTAMLNNVDLTSHGDAKTTLFNDEVSTENVGNTIGKQINKSFTYYFQII